MATEVREFGDKATLVVFTDDRKAANQAKNWRECFKVIPYEQEQYSKKRVALIGFVLYLPKTKRISKRLQRFGFSQS